MVINTLFLGPLNDFEESPSISPKFIYESLSIEIGEWVVSLKQGVHINTGTVFTSRGKVCLKDDWTSTIIIWVYAYSLQTCTLLANVEESASTFWSNLELQFDSSGKIGIWGTSSFITTNSDFYKRGWNFISWTVPAENSLDELRIRSFPGF